MSKYTTELRFICEDLAGLDESVDGSEVENVIENARPKIFNFDYPIFDSAYKKVLETKILKHFYTREIGLETFGLWKLKLNTKMNEIMPYYNLYYQSALLNFNPLYTKDLYRKKDVEINTADNMLHSGTSGAVTNFTGTGESTTNQTGSNTFSGSDSATIGVTDETTETITNTASRTNSGTESGEAHSDTLNKDVYSDTPQGALTGVDNETYLTNARKITNGNDSDYEITKGDTTTETGSKSDSLESENTTTESRETENTTNETNETESTSNNTSETETNISNRITENKDGNSVEDYLEHVYGFESGSASKLLMDYRKTFINVDMMIINDLEELFMQLW